MLFLCLIFEDENSDLVVLGGTVVLNANRFENTLSELNSIFKQSGRRSRFARRGSTIGFHLLWYTAELAMSTRLCLL